MSKTGTKKASKNAYRRAQKKEKKVEATPIPAPNVIEDETPEPTGATETDIEGGDLAPFEIEPDDPLYEQFKDLVEKFGETKTEAEKEAAKPQIFYDDDDGVMDEEEEAEVKAKLSKKAKKAANKLSIAELKAIAAKPELIEWTDPDAADPRLLISIKSQRNVVPVPGHWALKREYLSSKRGIEKPPFALPKFIQETGIAEMRDAILEKQAEASLKQKQRERVQGKMGKLDMDYNKLYEAFFRRQTKPEMTRFGEVYYEGKEYETNLKHMRPGELSEDLKDALNIPPGAPPPWLINQQRFGPPLSYPSLKIPGLNAPPPPGQTWGFHPGGYGKPPLDEFNRPLYGGDVFGTAEPHQNQSMGEPVEKTIWGELRPPGESEDEESEEEEEDEEDEDVDEEQGDGMQAPGGTATPSGIASTMPSEYGGETSIGGEFTLRKQRRGTETEESAAPRSAYQVLPEQNIRAQGFFGGDRKYDLQGAPAPSTRNVPMLGENNRRKRKADDVEISVDPDVLARDDKLDKDALKKRYDAERKAAESRRFGGIDQDDLSAMIAEESHKRLKKDEERRGRR